MVVQPFGLAGAVTGRIRPCDSVLGLVAFGEEKDLKQYLCVLGFTLGCGTTDLADDDRDSGPENATTQDTSNPGDSAEDTADGSGSENLSAGCGLAPTDSSGGVQLEIDAGTAGDGARSYWLSRPANYDPDQGHGLIIGLPGTNALGQSMVWYLGLESAATTEDWIFVYPDPLWRDFTGWGNLGGWLLGPHASPADGQQDLAFMDVLLDRLEAAYCIDRNRIFVTGHSWGGDMAAVVGCFMGDRIRAAVPAAANRPYWFEPANGSAMDCEGAVDVWTFYGIADDHFAPYESYPGDYGDQQNAFWLDEHQCNGAGDYTELAIGGADPCLEYSGCSSNTRYCLYGPATGHQIPSYFSRTVMDYFEGY